MLFQTLYLKIVLEQFEKSDCNTNSIFIDNGLLNIIVPSSSNYQALPETTFWYSLALGSLIYVMTISEPDILFALLIVSRFCNNLL